MLTLKIGAHIDDIVPKHLEILVRLDAERVDARAVQQAENLGDGHFIDIESGMETWRADVVGVIDLGEDLCLAETLHNERDQRQRHAIIFGQLLGGIGRLALLEPPDDNLRNHQDQKFVVVKTDVAHILLEIEASHILAHIRNHRTKKDDEPHDLDEQKQERQNCKRSVNGIVVGRQNLSPEIERTENLKADARHNARQRRIAELHLRVGYNHIYHRENQPGDKEREDLQDDVHRRTEDIHSVQKRHHIELEIERERTGDRDQNRNQEDQRNIVGETADQRSVLLHSPDAVEREFYLEADADDRIQEDADTDADEEAALRMVEIRLRHIEKPLGDVPLGVELGEEEFQDDRLVAEAARHAEDERDDRHQRKERVIGQGRSLRVHPLLDKELDREIYRLVYQDENARFCLFCIVLRLPNIYGKIPHLGQEIINYFFHKRRWGGDLNTNATPANLKENKKDSRRISRVLSPPKRMFVINLGLMSP